VLWTWLQAAITTHATDIELGGLLLVGAALHGVLVGEFLCRLETKLEQ